MSRDMTRGVHFISTSLEKLFFELKIQGNRKEDFVIGLSNSDFYLNALEYPRNLSIEEKDAEISRQLEKIIPNYTSTNYINKEISIKAYDEDEVEKSLIISIEKRMIELVINETQKADVFPIGIYPSFLMGDQESLKDLINKFDFLNIEEIEEGEDYESGEKRVTLVLFHDDEPLNLIEKIIENTETYEYDFLLDEYRSKLIRSVVDTKFKYLFAGIFSIQIVTFIVFLFLISNTAGNIEKTKVASIKVENQIKEIEKEIKLVPNWEARLKKLEEIFAERSTAINEILYAVKKSVPKGLFIEKLDIKSNLILMEGTTDDIDKVFRFERILEEVGFTNVKHTDIKNANNTGFSFVIESNLR